MSEAQEEYRERLRSIGVAGMLASDYPNGTGGQLADGFEVVYAQALRDVMAHLEVDPDSWIVKTRATRSIERFAAERGIDLDD